MPGIPALTPVDRSEFETTDIAVTHDVLTRSYVDHRPRISRPGADFLFRLRTATAGGLDVHRLKYLGAVGASADPFDFVTTVVLFAGRYAVGEHLFTAGDVMLVPLGAPLGVSWEHIDLQNVRFPLAAATRAAERLGVEPADFRFESAAPVSARMNQHWIATAGYVVRAFAGPEPMITNPLIHTTMLETLGATALAVFPNTTMALDYTAGPGRVPPAAIRRATAYIDAHAAEPITLQDIAAAARIGVRGLQAGFARHRGTTPMGYLREVRMEHAHRDLRAGDRSAGDTVAGIARRWGFTASGRFAAEYRRSYGQSPSRTLRT